MIFATKTIKIDNKPKDPTRFTKVTHHTQLIPFAGKLVALTATKKWHHGLSSEAGKPAYGIIDGIDRRHSNYIRDGEYDRVMRWSTSYGTGIGYSLAVLKPKHATSCENALYNNLDSELEKEDKRNLSNSPIFVRDILPEEKERIKQLRDNGYKFDYELSFASLVDTLLE